MPFYKAAFGRVTNATWSQLACQHATNKVIVVRWLPDIYLFSFIYNN